MATTTPGGKAPIRYPVLHDLDADFTLSEIISAVGEPDVPGRPRVSLGLAAAARWARLWRLRQADAEACATVLAAAAAAEPARVDEYDVGDDVAVLHAFEVAPLWRPPVATAVGALTPSVAEAWLALARHWIGLSTATGDLRFFNASCKLLGAVWTQTRPRHRAPGHPDPDSWSALTQPLAATAQLASVMTDDLTVHLASRLIVAAPSPALAEPDLVGAPAPGRCAAPPTIAVLAAAGSSTARRFLAAATAVGLPITVACWYGEDTSQSADLTHSGYATAWYPSTETPTMTGPTPAAKPSDPPSDAAAHLVTPSWDAVAAALRRHHPDLVVLLGMPILPTFILDLARLGVINAHNGALPHYRGMDAVGWTVINNDPVVCTLHLARPAVDQGEVLATIPLPLAPTRTLHARVKDAQLRLLLAASQFVAATGQLPACTPQHPGRQFYRLHPHLKRVLDAWANSLHPTEKG
ncbi:formyltransferase family protein [Parafrankia discariae]|uniref:formyltransferase family protein n=1 Tax=Parafrankia discariae TaxID=365528 RepID=UPI00037A14F6|nr:formyltransferase family protein [Parafrankia discariae]